VRPFILAVDLGQANDHTAIIGLRRADGDSLECIGIERLPLGTSYPDQVDRVRSLACNQFPGRCLVAVDATGVGAAVVDMLRPQVKPSPFFAVTITSGDKATREFDRWRVPKRDLIAAAQVALQQRRVKLPRSSTEAQVLVEELLSYRVTIGASGHDSYGNDWRQAPHDDLVLALSIGIYVADVTVRHVLRLSAPTGRLPRLGSPSGAIAMPEWQRRLTRRALGR
jgi:hypothetical protein